jgi:hypothetical protein
MIPVLAPVIPYIVPTRMIDVITHLGLQANLKLCLDAGDSASYDGSSQTWTDLSGGGYNFLRGTTNASQASDPTFNGVAGRQSSGEYFSYDGGDVFTLGQANPAWLQTFHKANAKLTIAEWIYLNNITSTAQAAADVGDSARSDGFNYVGMFAGISSSVLRAFRFAATNASSSFVYIKDTVETLNNNAWNFAAVSVDMTSGAVVFQINGTTESYAGQTYSSPSASSAETTLQIGAAGASQFPEATGCRVNELFMCDAGLTGANLLAIYNATKGKFGL